jgi:membrane-anchored mycosin MYCP
MRQAVRRATCVIFLLVPATAATPLVLDNAQSASAYAPTCPPRTGQPAAAPTDVPWAQQRYGTQPLAALADGSGITVAVVDSGVDANYAQLAGAVRGGGDLLDGGDGRVDCVGHGTGVASVIAARPLDGTNFQGLAPKATILAIRVSEQVELDGKAVGRTAGAAGFASAIRRAVDLRAAVINLSLVSYQDDAPVREAINYAVGHDVLVVAAAGNRFEQGNATPFPAAYDGVIGVGAIGSDGRRLASSQIGTYVDLVAPGGQIVTAALPQGRTVQEGTSFAAPFVSAAAALIRQYHPELSARQVAERLIATADPAPGGPHSNEYGAGVLNPYRALTDQVGGARTSAAPVKPAPAAHQATNRTSQVRHRALALAGAALALACLALLAAAILPHGRRRRWRPGLRG